jgi:PII-like signaling protein
MTETISRQRVEILVDSPLLPRIIKAAESAGIKAHTVFPALSGTGHAGGWSDDQITGASSKVLFVAITTKEKAAALTDRLAPLLDSYGLVLILSDVQVIRAAKF